jgi:hypothetical protein
MLRYNVNNINKKIEELHENLNYDSISIVEMECIVEKKTVDGLCEDDCVDVAEKF